MEENFDTEIEQLFEFGDPYIRAEKDTGQCNVPRSHRGEDMQEDFDRTANEKRGSE
jgi:hypothetical protein